MAWACYKVKLVKRNPAPGPDESRVAAIDYQYVSAQAAGRKGYREAARRAEAKQAREVGPGFTAADVMCVG